MGLSEHLALFLLLTSACQFAFALDASTIKDLRPKLSLQAEVLFPEDGEDWKFATTRFTSLGGPTASIVMRAGTENDVIETVKFARANNITFFPQNRGHGWNTKLNRVQNALFINLCKLDKVVVDLAKNQAIVSGGANISQVQTALYNAGKQMTVPSCDCIGVAGPALGGGVGRLMGNYGLMLDNIESLRVVLADGTLKTVSRTSNPDLFWAMRGAGHNFGIATEITFKVHNAVPEGKHYNLDMMIKRENIKYVFEWLYGYHSRGGLPKGLSLTLIMANSGEPGPSGAVEPFFLINYVYAGSAKEGRKIAAPLLAKTEKIVLEEMLKWTDLPGVGGLGLAAALCPKGDRYSMFGIDSKHLEPAIHVKIYDEYVDMLKKYPIANGTALLFQSHAQQAMHSISAESTAFPHRESNLFSVMTLKYPGASLDEPMTAWGKKIRSMVRQGSGYKEPRVYVNYAWGDEDLETRYGYDKWRLQRLRALKRKYDPQAVFSNYNGIL